MIETDEKDNRETTIDGLLNKSIWVEQPKKGFRIAIDTILLAAAVPAKEGESVLDIGSGVGGMILALAARVPNLKLHAIEVQPFLASLCQKNIGRNKDLSGSFSVSALSIEDYKTDEHFDHIAMNPPFHDHGRHNISHDPLKKTANTDEEGDIELWLEKAASLLKENGCLTLIHRADREKEIVNLLKKYFGSIFIKELHPKENKPPKRIIIRAYKNGELCIEKIKPLILHEEDGAYTKETDGLLRQKNHLPFI